MTQEETVDELHPLKVLSNRLKKIGIDVQFAGNYPWIYLDSINNVRVKEKTSDANHGFNIAWLPVRKDLPFKFTNTKEMFQLIRNYMTKPDFIRKRLLLLFETNDVEQQWLIVDSYNLIRNNKCYCGHTIDCDCGNPGISEFKSALQNNSISEEILTKLL